MSQEVTGALRSKAQFVYLTPLKVINWSGKALEELSWESSGGRPPVVPEGGGWADGGEGGGGLGAARRPLFVSREVQLTDSRTTPTSSPPTWAVWLMRGPAT